MRWATKVRHLGSLAVAVAALGGGLLAARRWAETHALAAVLGPGAAASALKVHWSRSAGCAEKITIPLASAGDGRFAAAQLSAGRMWFTYDLNSLLKKRLVLPRVVIEDALIDARFAFPDSNPMCETLTTHESTGPDAPLAPLDWLAGLRDRIESLEQEQFISGTQVAVDTAMLSEHWRAEFASIHQRAKAILNEARDIQQQLTALNNVLRHEAKVIAGRDRLEILKTTLVAMKSDLARTERRLREQQSRVREALLIEKNALHDQGVTFRAPDATRVAAKTTELWVAACLRDPARYSWLVREFINKPYACAQEYRGEDMRSLGQGSAEVAVASAKMSGEIAVGEKVAAFTATGKFHMVPSSAFAGRESGSEEARWQMSIGPAANCLSVDGHSLDPRSGESHVSLQCNGPGHLQAECLLSAHRDIDGTGQLQLRQWLGQNQASAVVNRAFEHDQLIAELLGQALVQLDKVPEEIDFRFSGPAAAPRPEIEDEASRWLADELSRLASERVAKRFDAAADKLDVRIRSDLDALNRFVALGRNEALQLLNQQLEELKTVEAGVLNDIQQRAGAHFARRPSDDLVK